MSGEKKLIDVLGIGVDPVNTEKVKSWVFDQIKFRGGKTIAFATVNGVMCCEQDDSVRSAFESADMVVPDGMPMVWLGKNQGFKSTDRVYGPELMWEICASGVERRMSHFLLGGKEGVADQLKKRFEKEFKGIQICGTLSPPFRTLRDDEWEAIKAELEEKSPDLVWVGLGSPKQELFMQRMQGAGVGVFLGVGAAFDIYTGSLKDSPQWVKKMGMQWFHRFLQEPRRLWYRYLVLNPLFIFQLIRRSFTRDKSIKKGELE